MLEVAFIPPHLLATSSLNMMCFPQKKRSWQLTPIVHVNRGFSEGSYTLRSNTSQLANIDGSIIIIDLLHPSSS